MNLDAHAVFGGSFNPPHIGHLNAISSAAQEFGLSKVNLLLAPQPPHKSIEDTTLQHRMEMLRRACEKYPYCQPDFTEIELPSPSYTVNTLRHLRETYPDKSILFFMGSDSLLNIQSWYEWESLLNYSHIIVLPRPQYKLGTEPELLKWINSVKQTNQAMLKERTNGALFFAETPLWDVSSTQLRNAINDPSAEHSMGTESIKEFVTPNVAAYIEKHNLYKSTSQNS